MKRIFFIDFKIKPLEIRVGYIPDNTKFTNEKFRYINVKTELNTTHNVLLSDVYLTEIEAKERLDEYIIKKKFKMTHNHVCEYCRKRITNKHDLTVDHIIPKSKGGKTEESNLVISCKKCNMEKRDKNPYDYFNLLNCKNTIQMRKENKRAYDKQKIKNRVSLNEDNLLYIAKHDSSYWDVNYFFNKKPRVANKLNQ